VVLAGSVVSFLILEGEENRAWESKLVVLLWSALEVIDLIVELSHLIVLFVSDCGSSLLEQVNKGSVFKSQGAHANVDSLLDLVFVSKVWQVRNSVFKKFLDPLSESDVWGLSELGLAELLLVVVINLSEEALVNLVFNVELDGVVSSGNGVDVEFNKVVSLLGSDEVSVKHGVEGNENGKARDEQTSSLGFSDLIAVVVAWHLGK
jgi:hypothetical protein